MRAVLKWTLAVSVMAAATAQAHDTWFEARPETAQGEQVLMLGTGVQYPTFGFPIGMEQIVASGCRAEGVPAAALAWVADRPDGLLVRSSQALRGSAGPVCWAQLVPFELEIGPRIVQIYLDEINALPSVRAAWAAQQARGVEWKESYVKHARIELDGARPPAAGPAPVPMGMDVLLQAPRRPVRVGDELVLQVLRDGRPLPGLPVELRNALSPVGFWHQTDAEGRVRFAPPLAGHWLLRGTDLRLVPGNADRWQSRFVTLAFEVVGRAAAAAQNGNSFSANARSANQTAATSAISDEPPSSTTRR